jgi:ribosomal protein S4
MPETELQIAKQQTSEQKLRVLKQQAVVLSLKGEGGKRLEEATELWDAMKHELSVMESRLDRLIFYA